MSETILDVIEGQDFSGALADLDHYLFHRPLDKGRGWPDMVFLKKKPGLTVMKVSLNKLSAVLSQASRP